MSSGATDKLTVLSNNNPKALPSDNAGEDLIFRPARTYSSDEII